MSRQLAETSRKYLGLSVAALLAAASFSGALRAEEHAEAALQHAGEAAAAQDSMAVQQHAAEGLKHIEAAKGANSAKPEMVEHLKQGESALDAAQQHSHWFNTTTAVEHANEGKAHLEAAGK